MKLQYIVRLEIKKLIKIELFYYNACLSTFTGNLASFLYPKKQPLS